MNVNCQRTFSLNAYMYKYLYAYKSLNRCIYTLPHICDKQLYPSSHKWYTYVHTHMHGAKEAKKKFAFAFFVLQFVIKTFHMNQKVACLLPPTKSLCKCNEIKFHFTTAITTSVLTVGLHKYLCKYIIQYSTTPIYSIYISTPTSYDKPKHILTRQFSSSNCRR